MFRIFLQEIIKGRNLLVNKVKALVQSLRLNKITISFIATSSVFVNVLDHFPSALRATIANSQAMQST